MSKEIVNKFGLKITKYNSIWDINNGAIKTVNIATTKNLCFPKFTNKINVGGSKYYVNSNYKQKYKNSCIKLTINLKLEIG